MDQRLQHIEEKIAVIADAIQTLARVEERMQVQASTLTDHESRLRGLERINEQRSALVPRFLELERTTHERFLDIEKGNASRSATAAIWDKLAWMIVAAMVAAGMTFLTRPAPAPAHHAAPVTSPSQPVERPVSRDGE